MLRTNARRVIRQAPETTAATPTLHPGAIGVPQKLPTKVTSKLQTPTLARELKTENVRKIKPKR